MAATPNIPAGTFNFNNLVVTFAGTTILGGVSVKVTRDSDQTSDEVSGNGDVVVIVNNDKRGKIEIELIQSSISNDFLTQRQMLFKATGVFAPVEVVDLNGRSVASGAEAWVLKVADADYGKEEANRTWTIRVANLASTVAGLL